MFPRVRTTITAKASHAETIAHDDVFGDITKEGPNFRNVGFVGTIVLMMKTQIGLGVLTIPSALDVLGMVPGIICSLAVAVITTWSGYIIGAFKLRHREVYSIDDAGGIMFGLPGRVVLSRVLSVYYVFNSGSAILGIAIGLNAVSTHATCTAVFVAVAAIVGFILASIRTLGKITWLALLVIMVTIAVGVQDRPSAAPRTDGPLVLDWRVAGRFFSIASEMRDPKKYSAAMIICQGGVTVVYAVIGCVIISYAFALPGVLVTMTIVTHRNSSSGSRHLTSNTPTHWLTWLGCTFGITLIAWIIASTIPVFDSLVSLIGALLGPVMCVQPMGAMWLYDNCVFLIILGIFLMVAGTYGSIRSIMSAYAEAGGSAAFSCKDRTRNEGATTVRGGYRRSHLPFPRHTALPILVVAPAVYTLIEYGPEMEGATVQPLRMQNRRCDLP
ncbi:hypothetical protein BDV19DRAFT_378484 [Aspergillus venezuelensis]